MNRKTLKALKGSIEHWERLASGQRKENENIGVSDCPLCVEFYQKDCIGCPVMAKTGEECCDSTPFKDAWRAHRFELNGFDSLKFKNAAKKELAFLKSLLP